MNSKLLAILAKHTTPIWVGFAINPSKGLCRRIGTWNEPFEKNGYGERIISKTNNTVIYAAGPSTVCKGGFNYDKKTDWFFILRKYQ